MILVQFLRPAFLAGQLMKTEKLKKSKKRRDVSAVATGVNNF